MDKVFALTSEKLVHNYHKFEPRENYTNFVKFFSSLEKAKNFAEKEYSAKIDWKEEDSRLVSPSLSFVKYYIREIKLEE